MANFLMGASLVYILGGIFVLGITEPTDEDHKNAPLMLAISWPIVALQIVLEMLLELIYGNK